jgi:putative membrane protein
MSREYLDADAKKALTAAIQQIEARSSAEVVIVVRRRSAPAWGAALVALAVAALATLAVELFAPWTFDLIWILIDPVLVGAACAVAALRVPWLARHLSLRRAQRRSAEVAARVAFFDKGIRRTRDRTGILVYVSLVEREAVVLADDGVMRAVPPEEWAKALETLAATVGEGATAESLASHIAALGDVLEPALPRRADDVNELPDEVSA